MKSIAVIGGGTSLSVILRGMKQTENINLTVIVTAADDGGSTGRTRRQLYIPVMGDVRDVMCAVAEEESIFTSLMNYRFDGECDDVGGHDLGNLTLTTTIKTAGGFTEAIRTLSKFLNVKGQIIPSSLQVATLYAVTEDGMIIRGESNILNLNNRIEKAFYQQRAESTREALQAIHEADVIVYGIGSLYTSIIPNLVVDGVVEQLRSSLVKKIYFYNAMTQLGETDDLTLKDHVAVIQKHSFSEVVNTTTTYNNRAQHHILEKYKDTGSEPVRVAQEEHFYQVLYQDVLNLDGDLIRHDSNKIRDVFGEIINSKDEQKCRLQRK